MKTVKRGKYEMHGMSTTPEYRAWVRMRRRCAKGGEYYGKLTVCRHWQRSFTAFLTHIGRRPSPQHSVDRIDNRLGYRPGNVRWATFTQQMQNTSRNWFAVFDGKKNTVSEWARFFGLNGGTIGTRMRALKGKTPYVRALFAPTPSMYQRMLTDLVTQDTVPRVARERAERFVRVLSSNAIAFQVK